MQNMGKAEFPPSPLPFTVKIIRRFPIEMSHNSFQERNDFVDKCTVITHNSSHSTLDAIIILMRKIMATQDTGASPLLY